MTLLHAAEGRGQQCIGHPQLRGSVRIRRKTTADGLLKLPITSLFVVRNIQCGYSFSL